MTPAEMIYQRRVRVPDLARETGNVAQAGRTLEMSRIHHYEWMPGGMIMTAMNQRDRLSPRPSVRKP